MNRLWDTSRYSPHRLNRTAESNGLRLRMHPDVHPLLRRELLTYCRWLRKHYAFPIRVNIYIPNSLKIRARDGSLCWGACFVPDDPEDSIWIDVAGGFKNAHDAAALQSHIWATLGTLTHELGHYFQYINGVSLSNRGLEWQATHSAHAVLDEYYLDQGYC